MVTQEKVIKYPKSYRLGELQPVINNVSFTMERSANWLVKKAVKEWLISKGYLKE